MYSSEEAASIAIAIALSPLTAGLNPASLIALTKNSKASSCDFKFGANPPSSPTWVPWPADFNNFANVWNTLFAICKDSLNVLAPTGIIINSWKSNVFEACSPPLITFNIGNGKTLAFVPPMYL